MIQGNKMSSNELRFVIIFMIGLFISVGCHEFGHAIMSHWLGDPTPESQGRTTLNPMAHLDPLGTVILPLILLITHSPVFFGWGKPVQINPLLFKRKISMSTGDILVSIAGPIVNIILALVFTLIIAVLYRTINFSKNLILFQSLMFYINLNLVLAVFNMLPIPPLDGGHVITNLLRSRAKEFVGFLEQYGMFILFIVIMVPGLLSPIFMQVQKVGILLVKLAGVPVN
jgi:Zn-dependent protease